MRRLASHLTANGYSFLQSDQRNRIRTAVIGTSGLSIRSKVIGAIRGNSASRSTRPRTIQTRQSQQMEQCILPLIATVQPGYFHIYRAHLTNGKYEQPEKLGPEINSGDAETNPYISSDQKILIFASYRKDNLNGGGNHYDRADLYVSVNRDGHWAPARHLEHGINTTASEGSPTMSPDGKWFYLTSERSTFEVPMKQKLTAATWKDRQQTIENGVGNIYRIPVDAL